jgi:hypothetical protein
VGKGVVGAAEAAETAEAAKAVEAAKAAGAGAVLEEMCRVSSSKCKLFSVK